MIMTTRTLFIATAIFFSFAPGALAAETILDYSECSHYLGLVSCNETTQVCAVNQDTGLPGCKDKSAISSTGVYTDYITRYPDLATCTQKSNCPYACTENKLQAPPEYFCSKVPPSQAQTLPAQPVVQTLPTQPLTQTLPAQPVKGVTLINPLQADSLEEFLLDILDFVIRIGAIIIVLMMVFVGYKFVVAQGSETALVEARQMLLWTVVGALVLLGAQSIALAIEATVQALAL